MNVMIEEFRASIYFFVSKEREGKEVSTNSEVDFPKARARFFATKPGLSKSDIHMSLSGMYRYIDL